jgi:hypothetical protein
MRRHSAPPIQKAFINYRASADCFADGLENDLPQAASGSELPLAVDRGDAVVLDDDGKP